MRLEFHEVDAFHPQVLSPACGMWIFRSPVPDVHPFALSRTEIGIMHSPSGISVVARKIPSAGKLPDNARILLIHPVARDAISPDAVAGRVTVYLHEAVMMPDRPPVLPPELSGILHVISSYGPVLPQDSRGIPLGFGEWTAGIYEQPESVAGRGGPGFCLECGGDLASLAGFLLRSHVRRADYGRAVQFLDAIIFDVLRAPWEVRGEFLFRLSRATGREAGGVRVRLDGVLDAILHLGFPRNAAFQLLEGARVLAGVSQDEPFRAILHGLGIRFSRGGDRLLTIPLDGGHVAIPFTEAMEMLSKTGDLPVRRRDSIWEIHLERFEGSTILLLHSGIFERRGRHHVFPVLIRNPQTNEFSTRGLLHVHVESIPFAQNVLPDSLQIIELRKTRRVMQIRTHEPPRDIDGEEISHVLSETLVMDIPRLTAGHNVLIVSRIPEHMFRESSSGGAGNAGDERKASAGASGERASARKTAGTGKRRKSDAPSKKRGDVR